MGYGSDVYELSIWHRMWCFFEDGAEIFIPLFIMVLIIFGLFGSLVLVEYFHSNCCSTQCDQTGEK